jgi:integrase
VTVAGSYSDVGHQYFDPGESRRRPLKGRGPRTTRTIAIPARLVGRLQAHLDEFVGVRADALVFTTPAGSRINLSRFNVNVWTPAREKLFGEDNPLRNVRRHDLRHSAITTWLNAGVTLKTAQRWSGHKTASVLLDTYLGVVRDDVSISLGRVEQALDGALDAQPQPVAEGGQIVTVPCPASPGSTTQRRPQEGSSGQH